MGKPVIGITTRTYFIPEGGGEPYSEVNLAACAYLRAVVEAGGTPLLVPLVADEDVLRAVLTLLDGVVLSGGWDIDPGLYGEEPHVALGKVDVRKDETERLLAGMLLEAQRPVLAVCRGAEIAVWQLAENEPINPQIPVYLNRLSDLLFVLARICNDNGIDDILWVPGDGPSADDAE